MPFKNFKGKLRRKSPKRTVSASGEFELLQMVSEPDTKRYANEDVAPKEVDCEIPHRLERGTKHSL